MASTQRTAGEAAHNPPAEPDAIRGIIRRYYLLWLGYALAGGFLFAVYPLFLRSRGLDQFQTNSVLAVYFLVTFLTDVPTGAFADALGRRRSFILGCAFRFSSFILYFFAHRYLVILLAEMIDGIGTTFCNGAIDAWGVDALDRAGFDQLRDRLFSRIAQLNSLGFMVTATIGAYVADINIAVPWLLGAAGYFACAFLGAALMREDVVRARNVEFSRIPAQIATRVIDGLREGFHRRALILLTIANAVFFAAWAPYWMQWPQFFDKSYGVGIWVVGWLYCLFTVGRLTGAEVVVHLRTEEKGRPARLGLLVATVGLLLFSAGTLGARPNSVMILLFVMNLCMGAIQPTMQTWLNEHIDSGERATLLSFNSTFATLGGSLGLLYSGAVADGFGISTAWQVSGLVTLAALPCYWMLRQQTNGPQPQLSGVSD